MPELPDITVYVESLAARIAGQPLQRLRIASPFILRTVEPPPEAVEGKVVLGIRRIGKQIVLALEDGIFIAIHLMIAGRFRWLEPGARIPRRREPEAPRDPCAGLAALDFPPGTLLVTEASTKRRAALRILRGEDALRALDTGGIEVLEADLASFAAALRSENHTLKRALTDPRLFSGIGNAYSDEILHRARLSPLALTGRLTDEEVERLHASVRGTLTDWIDRLRAEAAGGIPEKVTAFRKGMAVHGRYREPCPDCGSPVQRIVHAENECNYCPTCQTKGKLLADRALSRLLKGDWPRTLEELEEMRGRGKGLEGARQRE